MGKILKNFATKENKKTWRVDKKHKFLYRKCLCQFDSYKDQFFNFYDLLVPDFENLHNQIQLHDIFDTNNKFDDSSASNSKNSKYCETKPSSNMPSNEGGMCDDRFKSKFV